MVESKMEQIRQTKTKMTYGRNLIFPSNIHLTFILHVFKFLFHLTSYSRHEVNDSSFDIVENILSNVMKCFTRVLELAYKWGVRPKVGGEGAKNRNFMEKPLF